MTDAEKLKLLTDAVKKAIRASEEGSASDAVQDMLTILDDGLTAIGETT